MSILKTMTSIDPQSNNKIKELCAEVNKTNIFGTICENDLYAKDMSEVAMLLGYRRNKFNEDMDKAKKLYNSILKKKM